MSRVMSLGDGLGNERTVIDVTGYPSLRSVERDYFFAVLKSVDGNKAKAAKILGITVKSVYNKIQAYEKADLIGTSSTMLLDGGNVIL
jgi:DNA-binding NtrC family response regulator